MERKRGEGGANKDGETTNGKKEEKGTILRDFSNRSRRALAFAVEIV